MPYYSSDSPQVKAAKISGENRRRRAQERRERDERLARNAKICNCEYGPQTKYSGHTIDCAVWKAEA